MPAMSVRACCIDFHWVEEINAKLIAHQQYFHLTDLQGLEKNFFNALRFYSTQRIRAVPALVYPQP